MEINIATAAQFDAGQTQSTISSSGSNPSIIDLSEPCSTFFRHFMKTSSGTGQTDKHNPALVKKFSWIGFLGYNKYHILKFSTLGAMHR